MKLLITGGGGFVGARLAAHAARARHARRPDASSSWCWPTRSRRRPTCWPMPRVEARIGPLLDAVRGARQRSASTASSTSPRRCRANARPTSTSACAPTSTARAPCSTPCARPRGRGTPARAASSRARSRCSAPTRPCRCPSWSATTRCRRRKTSYGTHKLICEHLIADYTRKGYIDGRVGAADDGDGAAGPAQRRGLVVLQRHHPRAAGRRGVDLPGLARRVAPADLAGAHGRRPDRGLRGEPRGSSAAALALNLPAVNVTVPQMLDALEAVAGPAGARAGALRARRDASPASSPTGRAARRPHARRGSACKPDRDFADIIRQYIADCRAAPGGATRCGA